MTQALQEARKSLEKDEIPIGCVIVKDGQIIGRGIMRVRNSIRQSCTLRLWQSKRLTMLRELALARFDPFVTIEPCVMCSGAIGLARIPQVIYGATNKSLELQEPL